jgi:hypothetical protein
MAKFYDNAIDDDLAYERIESFGGGMDAFTRATQLPADASQYLENILIPDNLGARTRPGADRLGTARGGLIQGMIYFDTPTVEQLIVAAAAVLTKWSGSAWIAMAGWVPVDGAVNVQAAQGVDKVLFTDGTSMAIWDGTAFTTGFGAGNTDPPSGCTILLWHAGRMWASGFPGTGGSGKENDAVCASALLAFGQGDWNLIDWSFRVGGGEGDAVLGLVSLPTSVPEQAVLGVLKGNSIHIIRTDPTVTPTNYRDTMNPESVAGALGTVGRRSYCVLGNDLLYVAPDKSFRSLARMEAAAGQYQVSLPLSTPIQPWVDRINWTYASTISAVAYRQLAIFSVPLDAATSPNAAFVWNGRLQRWVGVWTGWTARCFERTRFSGFQRLVMGDGAGDVNQWKDHSDATDDNTYLDNGLAISTKVWTRAFLFLEPLNNKDAYHAEARFANSNASVNCTLNCDNSDVKLWTADMQAAGPTLPITLPFDLVSATNTPKRKGLRGLQPFNECYLKIESASGWFELRNVSMSAFINTLDSQ